MALRTLKGIRSLQNSFSTFLRPGATTVPPIYALAKFVSCGHLKKCQNNVLRTLVTQRASSSRKTDTGDNVEDLKAILEDAENFLRTNGYVCESGRTFGNTLILESVLKSQAEVIVKSLKKLQGSKHPLLTLAEDLYSYAGDATSMLKEIIGENSLPYADRQNPLSVHHVLSSISVQIRAIVILLVTSIIRGIEGQSDVFSGSGNLKIVSRPHALKDILNDKRLAHTIEKQRRLAEITEIIYAAYSIHQTVVTLPAIPQDVPNYDRFQHGNNLAALIGDLLLAKSSRALADLCNAEVTETMSNAIADFTESQFLSIAADDALQGHISSTHSAANHYSKVVKGKAKMWVTRHSLGLGSLLGNACYCNAVFAGSDSALQSFAYRLGESVALVMQAAIDIAQVQSIARISSNKLQTGTRAPGGTSFRKVEICSLPIIEALERQLVNEHDICNLLIDSTEYENVCYELSQRNMGIDYFCQLQEHALQNINQVDGESAKLLSRLIQNIQPQALV